MIIPLPWSGPFRRHPRRDRANASGTPGGRPQDAIGDWLETPLPHEVRSAAVKWAGTALIVALAVGLRALIDPWLDDQMPLATVYGAVAVAVWFAGAWAATVTAAVGFVACDYLFIGRRYVMDWSYKDANELALFGVGAGLTIVIGVRMRLAQARARENGRIALERQRSAERALEERDRAQAQAREADELLRVALKNSGIVLAQTDRELRYRWIHDPAGDPLAVAAMIGRRDDELHDSPEARNLVVLKRQVLESGCGVSTDLPVQRPRGVRTHAVTIEPLRDAAGAIIGVTTASVDITARKRAENALRESEELFRALAENVPQLAWMTGPDGDVFWYNRRWMEYTGMTLEEARGWAWRRVQHPAHVHRVTASFRRAIAAGTLWEDTFPLRGSDGQHRWFLTRAFPIHGSGGRITRWFGTSTDITVLRETQEALREAQRQVRLYADGLERTVAERTAKLEEIVHELEAFSYSIAHDMRAPLRSMIGYADILREEHAGGLDDLGRDYLGRISVSARRLDRLIQDVLNYSRIVREELPLEPVDARALVLEVLESYPNLAAAKDCVTVAELPAVMANRAALTQVLSNLLENAVKFVARGATPVVRVFAEEAEPPRPGLRGAWVRLSIEDNGIGIDPTVLPRLFEMFQRFTRPGLYEGTGIGLAIARKAVDRMGGVIGVESTVGHGSRFWFILPRADIPATAP